MEEYHISSTIKTATQPIYITIITCLIAPQVVMAPWALSQTMNGSQPLHSPTAIPQQTKRSLSWKEGQCSKSRGHLIGKKFLSQTPVNVETAANVELKTSNN